MTEETLDSINPYEAFSGMVRTFNLSVGAKPDIELRIKLIREEAEELIRAIKTKYLPEIIDALCDILYVTYGAADLFDLYLDTRAAATQELKKSELPSWVELENSMHDFNLAVSDAIRELHCMNSGTLLLLSVTNPNIDKDNLNKLNRLPTRVALEELAIGCWDFAAQGLGIDLKPFFREVHRTNMHKLLGPVRSDGKQLKPPNWKPPRIGAILNRIKNNEPIDCKILAHGVPAKSFIVQHGEGGYVCSKCGGLFFEIEVDIGMGQL